VALVAEGSLERGLGLVDLLAFFGDAGVHAGGDEGGVSGLLAAGLDGRGAVEPAGPRELLEVEVRVGRRVELAREEPVVGESLLAGALDAGVDQPARGRSRRGVGARLLVGRQ